jgi:hypothetical protein
VGVMPGRRGVHRHIDRRSFEVFSHPLNLSPPLDSPAQNEVW